jgi:hypothetical protein
MFRMHKNLFKKMWTWTFLSRFQLLPMLSHEKKKSECTTFTIRIKYRIDYRIEKANCIAFQYSITLRKNSLRYLQSWDDNFSPRMPCQWYVRGGGEGKRRILIDQSVPPPPTPFRMAFGRLKLSPLYNNILHHSKISPHSTLTRTNR